MNILITGGCGFIGSNLTKRLANQHSVTIIDDLSTGHIENIAGFDVEFVQADIANFDVINDFLKQKKFDAIVHLAAIASVQKSKEQPLQSNQVNFLATINLLDLAIKHQIKKFVFASSAAVYGDNQQVPKNEESSVIQPISSYGIDKFAAEQYVITFAKEKKINSAVFRFFNVFGPNQDPSSPYSGVLSIFLDAVINSDKPVVTIYGDGNQTRDFIYINDVVETLADSLQSDKYNQSVFNLATGSETSLLQVINELEKLSGKRIRINFSEKRDGDILRSVAEISLIKSRGFIPGYSFNAGLKEYFDHLSANK